MPPFDDDDDFYEALAYEAELEAEARDEYERAISDYLDERERE